MKKITLIFLLAVALVLSLATGGIFNWLDKRQEEAQSWAQAALDQGIALFRENRYTESVEILQGIPAGVIQDWHLPYYTASGLVMLKDYEQALGKYEQALALNPNNPKILFALGVTYYKLGKLGFSKSYFAAVLEIEPGNEEAKGLMDIMAKLERQQQQTGEAVGQGTGDEGSGDSVQ